MVREPNGESAGGETAGHRKLKPLPICNFERKEGSVVSSIHGSGVSVMGVSIHLGRRLVHTSKHCVINESASPALPVFPPKEPRTVSIIGQNAV